MNLLTVQMSLVLHISSETSFERWHCIWCIPFLSYWGDTRWGYLHCGLALDLLGDCLWSCCFITTYLTLQSPGISLRGRYGVMLPIKKGSGTGVYPTSTIIKMCLIQPSQMLFSVLDHLLAYTLSGTLSVPASFDQGQVLVFISYRISSLLGAGCLRVVFTLSVGVWSLYFSHLDATSTLWRIVSYF